LLDPALSDAEAPAALDGAAFALVSHGTEADPIFNYGNALALLLFEMTREEFTTLPSRFSAEPMLREDRAHLLDRVTSQGFIDDYSGVRISSSGKRFFIQGATVWNLLDETGRPYGQAALIPRWQPWLQNLPPTAFNRSL
jgi:hypothetical protein